MSTKLKLCKRHNGGKGKELPVTEFPKDNKRHDHLSDWCKQCWRDYRDAKAKPDKVGVKANLKGKAVKPATKAASKPAQSSKVKTAKASAPAAQQGENLPG